MINSDVDANTEIGSELILCINVCVAIDTMLNFNDDENEDIKCKQVSGYSHTMRR